MVLNLDTMTHDELTSFWFKYRTRSRKAAIELFPHKPKAYVKTANSLAVYAFNKATAITCREKGDILTAQVHEIICDQIYSDLPEWAKW